MSRFTDIKKQVFEASLWLSNNGFFGGLLSSGGNVSALDEGREFMAITPSSRQYGSMSWKDICILDLNGQIVEAKWNPSMETNMHLGIYKTRPDIAALVHTHQTYASVLSIINKPLPLIFDEVNMVIGTHVGVIPYALSGTRQLADLATNYFRTGAVCGLMQNHGAISLGADLPQALKYAEVLEKVCRIYYLALATGEPITTLDELI